MKVHYIKTILLLAVISTAACKKDNYPAPGSGLSGNIVDATTGAKVPEQTLNGGLVQLYQTTYPNPTPINCAMHSDGSYANNHIFDGQYKVVVTGPFTYLDTLNVAVKGQTNQDIKVVPNLVVDAKLVSQTSNSITVAITVTQPTASSTQQIARIAAMAGTTASLDINDYAYGAARVLKNTQSMANSDVTSTVFTLTIPALYPNTSYYVRCGARTVNNGNYYNYAPTIFQVTTNKE